MQRSLSDASHDVISVADAAQAQSLLRQRRFDIIVLDVNLKSEPDGFGFLEMLKKDFGTSGIPVVMVTGDRREDMLPRAHSKGAADCIQKPLSYERLKARLDELVAESRRVPKAAVSHAGGPLVLHVEDDPEWADLVRGWLAGNGFALHRVASRPELLRFLENSPRLPDCLLLDLGLEGVDGLKVCDELKAHPHWRKIPIVILTSREDRRVAGFQHQAIHLISKLSKDASEELVAAMRSIISQQECAAGVLELGDIRLDPGELRVYRNGILFCTLDQAAFAVLRLLMDRAPSPVPDADIRAAFLRRHDYQRRGPKDQPTHTVEVFVSKLRRMLGDEVGARISRVHRLGYVYLPSGDKNQPKQ
jgi:DNA-binding response OmpR family regulator